MAHKPLEDPPLALAQSASDTTTLDALEQGVIAFVGAGASQGTGSGKVDVVIVLAVTVAGTVIVTVIAIADDNRPQR